MICCHVKEYSPIKKAGKFPRRVNASCFSYKSILKCISYTTSSLNLLQNLTQETVNKVIAYIQEHIYENLTVADLAAYFYLHPDYLSRLFKKHAHTSVSHYMALQKTATAQSLLREGYTVAQVQEKLNYSSYAYFFKAFQKNAGVSPSK